MEYVFGTQNDAEILKIVWSAHTDLKGYQEVVREFQSEKITDNFHVVRKLDSKEDLEGNCYDWYIIDRHYRMIDRTEPLKKKEEQNRADIDYISIMTGVDLP